MEILKSKGIGLLISTHNLSFGQDLFDSLMILRDGIIKLHSKRQKIEAKYGNMNLENIYKEVNQDYYKHIEGLLDEINYSSDKEYRNTKVIG